MINITKKLHCVLPMYASENNIKLVKNYVLKKYIEREIFYDNPEPYDLNECMFSALFTKHVFGGLIQGNKYHQYVLVNNKQIVDINDDTPHVLSLLNPYEHDHKFIYKNKKYLAKVKSYEERVKEWVIEFVTNLYP